MSEIMAGRYYVDLGGRQHGPMESVFVPSDPHAPAIPQFFDPAWKVSYWKDGAAYDPPDQSFGSFSLDIDRACDSGAGLAELTESFEPVSGTRQLRVAVWIGIGMLSADATVSGNDVTLSGFIFEIGANRFPILDPNIDRVAVSTPKGCRSAKAILAARALEEATA